MRRLVVGLALLAALALPAGAAAHPLGNFTVNRYAGIEVAGSSTYVRYALDLAEIPTYQLGAEVRAPGYAPTLARRLELTLDGRRAPLRVLEQRVTQRPGAGGLETLRLDVVYVAAGSGENVRFRDLALPGRIGWREITVSARDGAKVVQSNAPSTSESQALTAYPTNLLRSPLDVTSVTAVVDPGRRARHAAHDRRGACSGAREWGVRGPHRAGRHLRRRSPRLASHRRLLGRGARTHPGSRKGARRRVPGRDERDASACVPPRRHRHHRAHRRRLRDRNRDPRALPVHPPRAALPLADTRLRPARGRGRCGRAASAAPFAGAAPLTITTITTTIITAMTTATGITTIITITTTASPRRASSAWELPPVSCPARRRSSSCSRRSRCIAWASGWC